MEEMPAVQLIVNPVVERGDGSVLLRREEDARWTLPDAELEPYEHPEDAAGEVLGDPAGLVVSEVRLANVQSFRGRRGWHVTIELPRQGGRVPVAAGKGGGLVPARRPPRTAHGAWEGQTVAGVLAS
jgi:ADP-ribose pyrophosphatase YjhB (NUDIX family)